MSEHQVIADLLADLLQEQRATTAAVASLAHAIAHAGQGTPAVRAETLAVIEKAAQPPKPVPAAAPSTVDAPVVATPASSAPSEPTSGPSFAEVSKAIQDLVKTDKAKVVAALTRFAVKRGSELQPAQYSEFMEALA